MVAMTSRGRALAARPQAAKKPWEAPFLLAATLAYPLIVSPLIEGGYADLSTDANVEASASNSINQAFWLLMLAGVVFVGRRMSWSAIAVRLWPLTAYLVWSAATLLWAIAPDIVFRRLLLQVCVVGAIVLSVFAIEEPEDVHAILLRVIFAALLVNLIAIVVRPPTPLGHAGIYFQKNELGLLGALGFIVCLTSLGFRRFALRAMAFAGLPIAAALLLLSQSKTSILLAGLVPAIGLGSAALARVTGLPAAFLGATVTALLIPPALITAEIAGWTSGDLLQTLFGDRTFTGRTDIWSFAWDQIMERPLVGHGFNGFWGIGEGSAASRSASDLIASILQAHNGYLDILLETGLVGFAIIITLLVSIALRGQRILVAKPGLGLLILMMVAFSAFHNLFESTAARRFHPVWIFLLVAAALAARADPLRPAAPASSKRRPGRC